MYYKKEMLFVNYIRSISNQNSGSEKNLRLYHAAQRIIALLIVAKLSILEVCRSPRYALERFQQIS